MVRRENPSREGLRSLEASRADVMSKALDVVFPPCRTWRILLRAWALRVIHLMPILRKGRFSSRGRRRAWGRGAHVGGRNRVTAIQPALDETCDVFVKNRRGQKIDVITRLDGEISGIIHQECGTSCLKTCLIIVLVSLSRGMDDQCRHANLFEERRRIIVEERRKDALPLGIAEPITGGALGRDLEAVPDGRLDMISPGDIELFSGIVQGFLHRGELR